MVLSILLNRVFVKWRLLWGQSFSTALLHEKGNILATEDEHGGCIHHSNHPHWRLLLLPPISFPFHSSLEPVVIGNRNRHGNEPYHHVETGTT